MNSPKIFFVKVELPAADYYKHETHHYYHAGPPRVYKVHVPVTQKPYTVHVPQNVPVNFVPVNVPARHDLGPISVVELDPFSSRESLIFVLHIENIIMQKYGLGVGRTKSGQFILLFLV